MSALTGGQARYVAKHHCACRTGLMTLSLLLLPRIADAQVTAIPSDERLTGSVSESKTQQQWLVDLASDRQSVEAHPDEASAWLMLAKTLHALGETETASQALDHALKLNPKLAEALIEKGAVLADLTQWSEATEFYRRAVAASPDNTMAHLSLGDMLLRTGEFDGAAGEFRTVVRLDGKSPGAWQGLGLVHLQEGSVDEAAEDFRHALAIRPGYIDAEKGLAHALTAAHQWAEAAALLKSLVAANPNSSEETVALGNVLAAMGDKEGAEKQFARGRELANDDLILLRAKGENNWGVTLRKEGKFGEAADAFRRAIHEDPGFCEAHDNLGGVLWVQKDAVAAMSEFQAAVQCDPNLASARNNLGNALLYSGHDLDKAIAEFRAAVALRPGFALAHLNLGKALATKQNFADAENDFRCAILIEPELASAHMGLGLALAAETSGVSAEARAEMETALHLDPALRDVIPQAYLVQMQRQ